jgi:hypothetical protein
MRTTLTIEPAVAQKLRRRMTERNQTMKDAVNELLRAGLESTRPSAAAAKRFRVEPHACGFKPGIDLDKIGQLADELEAEATVTKLAPRKRRR